jgi:hypothetical protein
MGVESSVPASDFLEETKRILAAADKRGVVLRVLGALAFHLHCPKYRTMQQALGREFSDIDFASYANHRGLVTRLFLELGYEQDLYMARLAGGTRLLFIDRANGRHSDVFFDELRFSHTVPFRGRLELDHPTIPLVDLLLEKMQIVQLNEKDIIDTYMLLREHALGSQQSESIDIDYLAALCSDDWGLGKTVTLNLSKLATFLDTQPIDKEGKEEIAQKIAQIQSRIASEPKTVKWKLRSLVGEKVRWYRHVEEVFR